MATQLRMADCDSADRLAYDVGWRRITIRPKDESGPRVDVGVSPAVEDDTGDIFDRIETARGEHGSHLLSNLSLVISEGRSQHLCTPGNALFFARQTRFEYRCIKSQHNGFIGVQRLRFFTDKHRSADIAGEAESSGPYRR